MPIINLDYDYDFTLDNISFVSSSSDFSFQTFLLQNLTFAFLAKNRNNKNYLTKFKNSSKFQDFLNVLGSTPHDLPANRDELTLAEFVIQLGGFVEQNIDLCLQALDIAIDAKEALDEEIDDRKKAATLEQILEAVTDEKLINTHLGKALNYNVDSELSNYPVIARKDSEYLDFFDGEVLPHEHYDFSRVFQLATCPSDTVNKFYLSKEMVSLLSLQFFNGRSF